MALAMDSPSAMHSTVDRITSPVVGRLTELARAGAWCVYARVPRSRHAAAGENRGCKLMAAEIQQWMMGVFGKQTKFRTTDEL